MRQPASPSRRRLAGFTVAAESGSPKFAKNMPLCGDATTTRKKDPTVFEAIDARVDQLRLRDGGSLAWLQRPNRSNRTTIREHHQHQRGDCVVTMACDIEAGKSAREHSVAPATRSK